MKNYIVDKKYEEKKFSPIWKQNQYRVWQISAPQIPDYRFSFQEKKNS